MPFIAACPQCRTAKFRAPNRKRGTFATCPTCRTDFLLVPDATGFVPAVEYNVPPIESEIPEPELVEVYEVRAEPAAASPMAAVEAPVVEAPVVEVPPVVQQPAYAGRSPKTATDIPFRLALVALIAFGVAVVAGQFPYGLFVAVPVAALGLLAAAASVLGLDARKWIGWAGVGLNGVALMLLVAVPGWLGISTWTPAGLADAAPKPPTAAGRDGSLPLVAEWVDARTAVWEQADVRVAVAGLTVLADPKASAKSRRIVVALKVTNVGVARAIEFAGWSLAPDAEPSLTTESGTKRKLDAPAKKATIFPGKTADSEIAFDLPTGPATDLLLELPARAVGTADPVRFRLPRVMFSTASTPK